MTFSKCVYRITPICMKGSSLYVCVLSEDIDSVTFVALEPFTGIFLQNKVYIIKKADIKRVEYVTAEDYEDYAYKNLGYNEDNITMLTVDAIISAGYSFSESPSLLMDDELYLLAGKTYKYGMHSFIKK